METLDIVGSGMEEKWEREGKTGEGLFTIYFTIYFCSGFTGCGWISSCSAHWSLKR